MKTTRLVMFALLLTGCPVATAPDAPAESPATATQKAADAGKVFAPAVDAGKPEAPEKAAEALKPDAGK